MAVSKNKTTKTVGKTAVAVAPSGPNGPNHPPHWKKLGRKTLYTEELAELICDRIASGETLLQICREEGMPSRITVLDWLKRYDSFLASYREARARQADHTYDSMVEMEKSVKDGEIDPQAARVILWSQQWRAARMSPSNYSEKVINEHTGKDGGAIQMQTTVLDAAAMSQEERDVLRALLQAAKARKEGA